MPDLSIHFQCDFEKIKQATDESSAILIQVVPVFGADLSTNFLAYDTAGGGYAIDKQAKYLMLLFQGEKGIFTTLRKDNDENRELYNGSVGMEFELTFTNA